MKKQQGGSGRSDALHFSLAEFSWILLFLAIGALALLLLYLAQEVKRADAAEVRVEELESDNEKLRQEVNFLQELLAEKKNGVVPCWRRPEGVVPELMGTILIKGRDEILLSRNRDGMDRAIKLPEENRQEVMVQALTELFSMEIDYSREKNCYLRLRIVNETNSFKFYQEVADAAAVAGIVVVQ